MKSVVTKGVQYYRPLLAFKSIRNYRYQLLFFLMTSFYVHTIHMNQTLQLPLLIGVVKLLSYFCLFGRTYILYYGFCILFSMLKTS